MLVIAMIITMVIVRILCLFLFEPEPLSLIIMDFICGVVGSIIILLVFDANRKDALESQTQLRESIQFLHNISDANPHLLFAKDDNDRLLFVNKAVETWVGKSRKELIGKHKNDIPAIAALIHPAPHDGKESSSPHERRIQHIQHRDTQKWLNILETPIRDAEQMALGKFYIAIDVTAQELFEKELKWSVAKYRNIFENSPVGMAVMHTEKFEQVNQALSDMSGYTQEELTLMPLKRIVNPTTIDQLHQSAISQVKSGTVSLDHELTFKHKDGSDRYVQVRIAPLIDAKGNFVESFITISDITTLKD
ncbi:MAG: PAS domain-containing protein, partial [Bacteroidota bacterium]